MLGFSDALLIAIAWQAESAEVSPLAVVCSAS
jgi:hypothetical protein